MLKLLTLFFSATNFRAAKCSCGMQEELAMLKQELEESRARVGELAVELDNERAKGSKVRDKYNEAKELLGM